jgi:hypothetical protein
MTVLTVSRPECTRQVSRLIAAWRTASPGAVVLPVFCTSAAPVSGPAGAAKVPYPRVIFGEPLPPQTTLEEALAAIERLATTTADA